MSHRTFIWAAAALFGIVATATIAWSASQIAGQRIGLSSEPLSVASGLVPAGTTADHHPRQASPVRHRGPTQTTGRHGKRAPTKRHSAPPAPASSSTAAAPTYSAPTYSAPSASASSPAPSSSSSSAAAQQTTAAPAKAPQTFSSSSSQSQSSSGSGSHDGSGDGGGTGSGSGGGSHRDD